MVQKKKLRIAVMSVQQLSTVVQPIFKILKKTTKKWNVWYPVSRKYTGQKNMGKKCLFFQEESIAISFLLQHLFRNTYRELKLFLDEWLRLK